MVSVGDGVELFASKNPVDHPKAVVVLVHGLAEHSGRYDHVAARLNTFGYSVYRFDNRGHGRSGGERGFIGDYQLFLEDADTIVRGARQENPGIPVFMLGHSMGGFITACYGLKYPDRLSGQVLSGAGVILVPAVKDYEFFDFDAAPHTLVPNSLTASVSRDPEVVKAYVDDPLVLKEFTFKLIGEIAIKGAKRIMETMGAYRYPCLILHGGDDQLVPADASKYFYEHISSGDKQLKIYDGLFHEILNEPEKEIVLEDIHQWIEMRI
jgi:acylglycerol lipase